MKVIVAGSRSVTLPKRVKEAVDDAPFNISELVHGDCAGPDTFAKEMAAIDIIDVEEVTAFPADWNKHGKSAGPIRNEEMAEYADALIAVWDGQSRGTRNMINTALDENLHVYVHIVKNSTNGGENNR